MSILSDFFNDWRKKIAQSSSKYQLGDLTLLPWSNRRSLDADLQIALNDQLRELDKQGGNYESATL